MIIIFISEPEVTKNRQVSIVQKSELPVEIEDEAKLKRTLKSDDSDTAIEMDDMSAYSERGNSRICDAYIPFSSC